MRDARCANGWPTYQEDVECFDVAMEHLPCMAMCEALQDLQEELPDALFGLRLAATGLLELH